MGNVYATPGSTLMLLERVLPEMKGISITAGVAIVHAEADAAGQVPFSSIIAFSFI